MKVRFFCTVSIAALAIWGHSDIALAQSQELIDAAKAEGTLTTIALPRDWCGYGALIDDFKAKYALEVEELDPDASWREAIEAVQKNEGANRQAPDVINVGLSFGPYAKAENLIQPHKVATWDAIPGSAKDPDGYWYGNYYGVLSFVVNKQAVPDPPDDWQELLRSDYAGSVALGGDPLSSKQAIDSVYAAGLSRASGDAPKAAEEGLNFFAELNKSGNLAPVVGTRASLADGSTSIVIAWDYNGLAWRDVLAGNPPIEVVIPKTAVVADVAVLAINANAPHPNAAKLWMEYLYSDEGQIARLKSNCHPIRFRDLVRNAKIPQDILDRMPPSAAYESAIFPTADEQAAAKEAIATGWEPVVGTNVR